MRLPAHDFLDERRIPYRKRVFPPTTEKGAASVARALGCREGQMVKTLIFTTKAGEHVMVLLPADKNAISGHLKKALGSRDIRLAPPDAIRALTGYEIGSIPPFHWQPPGFRSLIDAGLVQEEVLGVGAGVWGHEVMIAPDHLIQAAQAAVVNLTDNTKPIFEAGASPGA